MKKRGPKPKFGDPMKRKIITLDDMTIRKAAALAQAGGSNFSAIVRDAIAEKYERYQRG